MHKHPSKISILWENNPLIKLAKAHFYSIFVYIIYAITSVYSYILIEKALMEEKH